MKTILTVRVEFHYPDNPLVISPHCSTTQLEDVAPKFNSLGSYLKSWFSDEIEAELSMVLVWCNKLKFPTVLLPKTIWNSEAKLIVGEGVPQAISNTMFGSLPN